jgi:hypothetical protein
MYLQGDTISLQRAASVNRVQLSQIAARTSSHPPWRRVCSGHELALRLRSLRHQRVRQHRGVRGERTPVDVPLLPQHPRLHPPAHTSSPACEGSLRANLPGDTEGAVSLGGRELACESRLVPPPEP